MEVLNALFEQFYFRVGTVCHIEHADDRSDLYDVKKAEWLCLGEFILE